MGFTLGDVTRSTDSDQALTWLGAPEIDNCAGSAELLSIRHVASGDGIVRDVETSASGLLFTSLSAADARSGLGRANLFACTSHATDNALLVSLSFGLG